MGPSPLPPGLYHGRPRARPAGDENSAGRRALRAPRTHEGVRMRERARAAHVNRAFENGAAEARYTGSEGHVGERMDADGGYTQRPQGDHGPENPRALGDGGFAEHGEHAPNMWLPGPPDEKTGNPPSQRDFHDTQIAHAVIRHVGMRGDADRHAARHMRRIASDRGHGYQDAIRLAEGAAQRGHNAAARAGAEAKAHVTTGMPAVAERHTAVVGPRAAPADPAVPPGQRRALRLCPPRAAGDPGGSDDELPERHHRGGAGQKGRGKGKSSFIGSGGARKPRRMLAR